MRNYHPAEQVYIANFYGKGGCFNIYHLFLFSDENDFNSSRILVIFPADGVTNVLAPIPIIDDEVNEANRQYFIAHLEILEAINRDLITLTRDVSTCIIHDNDGELHNMYCL